MSCSNKLTPAEQSRLDYQILRTHSPRAAPLAPDPHPDNPFLPDVPGEGINQLHLEFQGAPFKVIIPRWAAADEPITLNGTITLRWDGTLETVASAKYPYTTPLDPLILFIELELPANRTDTHGTHQLSYEVELAGNFDDSDPLIVNIDRLPPVTNGMVTVPPEVEADGITKTYLDANGHVDLGIRPYSVAAIGDVIDFYFGEEYPGELVGTFTRSDLTTPITAELTTAEVGTSEGMHLLYYYITDRKGNVSATSAFRRVDVVLTDPPLGLLAPDIPLNSDGLIDLADAQTPVVAGIVAQYTNFVLGRDELVMIWDGQRQTPVPIGGFPVHAIIPFAAVFNGDPGQKTVTVSYDIKRGNALYPSPPTTVTVDLRKPGSVIDPNNPGPPNPLLALPNLKGASGTNVDNVLTEADNIGPATVEVALFADADADDFVQLVYNGTPVSDADGGVVTLVGTPPFPNPLVFTVRWSVFDAVGNGNPIPLHYIIGHPINSNVDTSRAQQISVDIVPEVIPLPAFINLSADGYLNCSSLRQDPVLGTVVQVLVGPDPRLAGQSLSFAYQGYTDAAGSIEKPGTNHPFNYEPSSQEAAAGFVVPVPYAPVLSTSVGFAKIAYLARINGKFVRAESPVVTVVMRLGGGGSCVIPPPI